MPRDRPPRGASWPLAKRTPGARSQSGLAAGGSGLDAPDRASGRARSWHQSSTLKTMSSIDLRRLHLRAGEVRQEDLEVALEPFLLGGQRYESHPETVAVQVQVT